jgi:hypothetical protein
VNIIEPQGFCFLDGWILGGWFVILIWFFSLRGVFWEEAMERRRWSEVGLVILGVLLHSSYMLSIFDIYFKTPIVHGMNPEPLGIRAPAKRLVLFIGALFLSYCCPLHSHG